MAVAPAEVSIESLEEIARTLRRDILRMIAAANSGHPGGSLSAVEILTALYFGGVLREDPRNPGWPDRDRFILSKGRSEERRVGKECGCGWWSSMEYRDVDV